MTSALRKTCLAVMLLSSLLWVFGCGTVTPAKSDAGGDSGGGSGGAAGSGTGGAVTGTGGVGGSGRNGSGGSGTGGSGAGGSGTGGAVGSGGSGGMRDAGSGGSGGAGGALVDAGRDVAMGACTTDNDCVFRPNAGCCGMCLGRSDMVPPQDIICANVICAAPAGGCVCINGRCGGGTLPQNAACMPNHDLCGSGLRCCQQCSPLPDGPPCQAICMRPVTMNGASVCPPPPP